MRVSAVAVYTLAALVAKDAVQLAIALPALPPITDDPELEDSATSRTVAESAIATTTSPEQLAAEPFFEVGEREKVDGQNITTQPDSIAPPEALTAPERITEGAIATEAASASQPLAPIRPQVATLSAPLGPVQTLTDIHGHWAQPYIEALATTGVMQGFYEDGTFRPDAPVTRAHFAAMIRKAFPMSEVRSPSDFTDVPTTHWAHSAIQAAYQAGFLDGHSGQTFAPNHNISRAEAVETLSRGLGQLNSTSSETSPAMQPTLYQGRVDQFRASAQSATRAEIAALLYQAMSSQGKAPALDVPPPQTPTSAPAESSHSAAMVNQPSQPSQEILIASTSASTSDSSALLLAQTSGTNGETIPSANAVQELQDQLQDLETPLDFGNEFAGSPAVTISNPSGFGADNFTGFVNFGFQSRTRYSDVADGTLGIGLGLGDARESVGVQLSYTIASFGGSRDFGTGGFNAKLHHQFSDGLSVAAGWEGFITTGEVDFEDSIYGSVTQIFRTADDLDDPFSRIALTAGLGNGRFRSEDAVDDGDDAIGLFGSMALRVARPVSAIVEWTGQDLAVGLSITPIRDVPWVITPAFRDIAGAGDGARFVLGTGVSFRF